MNRHLLSLVLILVAACSRPQEGPVQVDVIGTAPQLADPVRTPPGTEAAVLLDATAQGLVALDGEGEVAPALAQRWTVLDDGVSYIFRLDDFEWADGTMLTAGQIARQLNAARRTGGRNRLAAQLSDIEQVNAVTPEILEITLGRPRLDILHLLAQPDLAIVIGGEGLGPLMPVDNDESGDGGLLLAPRPAPEDHIQEDGDAPSLEPEPVIELRFLDAAMAVARFQLGQTALVLGGDWTSLPYAEAIDPADALVFDPVEGLFGLAIVEQTGFLSDPRNRDVLALSIDRQQLAALLDRPQAEPRNSILPSDARGTPVAVAPAWAGLSLEVRRSYAREVVARWTEVNGSAPRLRVALPDAPGSRALFAVIRANWARVGIDAVRVGIAQDADLRLIDRVAPTEQASWYLAQFPCTGPITCSNAYREALEAIETAPSMRVRALRTAEAAAALEDMRPFIPLLRPVRWALVSARVTGFHPNRYASHPLHTLIAPAG